GPDENHLCAGVLLQVLPGLVEELKGQPHMVLVQAVDDGEIRHVRQPLAGARAHGGRNDSFEARRNAVERNAERAGLAHNGEPASGRGVWWKPRWGTTRMLNIAGDPASSRCHSASMKGGGTPRSVFTRANASRCCWTAVRSSRCARRVPIQRPHTCIALELAGNAAGTAPRTLSPTRPPPFTPP